MFSDEKNNLIILIDELINSNEISEEAKLKLIEWKKRLIETDQPGKIKKVIKEMFDFLSKTSKVYFVLRFLKNIWEGIIHFF